MDTVKKSFIEQTTEDILNDEGMRLDEEVLLKSTHKTIFVTPGEAVKLTPNELKPKNINLNIERLMYNMVSGKPKFGKFFIFLKYNVSLVLILF